MRRGRAGLAVVIGTLFLAGCSVTTTPPAATVSPAPTPTAGGLPPRTSLTAAAGRTVDQPGQVLDGLDVSGTLQVDAPGVVIRNSRVTCRPGDYWAVAVEEGASLTITDSELTGACSAGALQGQDFTARRILIHDVVADGIKIDGGNVLVEESRIERFTPSPEAHADGVQASVPLSDVTLRDNLIDPGASANSALFLVAQLDNGSTPGPVLLEGNTFGGGGDTVHIAGDGGDLGQVSAVDNVWRRNSQFSPVYKTGYPVVSWTGNRYEDGTPVPPP